MVSKMISLIFKQAFPRYNFNLIIQSSLFSFLTRWLVSVGNITIVIMIVDSWESSLVTSNSKHDALWEYAGEFFVLLCWHIIFSHNNFLSSFICEIKIILNVHDLKKELDKLCFHLKESLVWCPRGKIFFRSLSSFFLKAFEERWDFDFRSWVKWIDEFLLFFNVIEINHKVIFKESSRVC